MADQLVKKKCVPCEGGVAKLDKRSCEILLAQVPGWKLDGDQLKRQMKFKDFVELMAFVNRMADVAEGEGHHPDFHVHWNQLDIEIWTHAAGGLTENDFILAAKIDSL